MKTLLVALALLIDAGTASGDVPAFFAELYERYELCYMDSASDAYSGFCSDHRLAPADSGNQRTFHELSFLHDLLTGSGAADCVPGGILEIPYFWHWVDPNPRHLIRALPESTELSLIEPPAQHSRYASFADIDRLPVLFFSDLVSETPGYWHSCRGSFFTFGWCSEREMAFLALVESLGYQGRIQRSGIHSWSELWCTLRRDDGSCVGMVARVDNTFDALDWIPAPVDVALSDWQSAVHFSRDVRWYNVQAHSAAQRQGLRDTEVSPLAVERICAQASAALNCREDVSGAPRPN